MLLAIICLFIGIGKVFNIGCPFLFIFGIPCPTCGTTRAIISLLRLDIDSYLKYNPMALPMCIAVLLMLNTDIIKHKRIACIFSVSVAILNLLVYFYRF